MKTVLKFGIVALALLVALSACTLSDINVGWNINYWTVVGPNVVVNYTAYNMGKYDLTGVNLEVAVEVPPGVYISAKTPNFSLAQGQYYTSNITIFIAPASSVTSATVLSVGMDKP